MEFHHQPILKVFVPKSGVTVGNPEFEWRSVAKEYGMTFEAFAELKPQQQEGYIAHYRTVHHTEAVLNKDANDKAKLGQKK